MPITQFVCHDINLSRGIPRHLISLGGSARPWAIAHSLHESKALELLRTIHSLTRYQDHQNGKHNIDPLNAVIYN